MPYQVVDLPTMTFSVGSSATAAVKNLDDAAAITIFSHNSTSTGGISVFQVQVEPSDTGTAWRTISSATVSFSSAASVAFTLSPVAYRQLRITATAADNSTGTSGAGPQFAITKQITV